MRRRQFSSSLLVLVGAAGLGFGPYHRAAVPAGGATNSVSTALSASNAPIQRISDEIYAVGRVRLDKKNKTISFPATVNMAEGTVEYALVHVTGKVHESVLRTEVAPYQVHLARLLLAPSSTNAPAAPAKTPIELQGPPVDISVEWQDSGKLMRLPLEDLVLNILTKTRLTRGEWIYNGSQVVQGTFLAEQEGSIISVIADPNALINNPRPGREDDEIWQANKALVPPVGTGVRVIVELAGN